ncbi:hypothetical protein BJV77DRAFT_964418 [Russula vinacea]|nr:hypothetical protein BJV77DRAFT_964418 [Russula vinacea]
MSTDRKGFYLQFCVWDYMYSTTVLHTVKANQHVIEWCGGLATSAVTIILAYLVENGHESDDTCKELAMSTLKDYTFLYVENYQKKGETVDKVELALTLWQDGSITCKSVAAATKAKKSSPILKTNVAKETESQIGGKQQMGTFSQLERIFQTGKAKSIAKKNKRKDITVCTSFDQNKDECGLLRDNTDSDD